MTVSKRAKKKTNYFTPTQANAMLPLLRSILRDVTTLAHELNNLQERSQIAKEGEIVLNPPSREELEAIEAQFDRGRDRMHEYLEELDKLGIELKDPFAGLVDFRAMMDGREVYLCWRMDEPDVSHWHELDSGFAGRQKLMTPAASN